jgi:glycosyltransferase involved in cell wall biosynthesis
MKTALYTTFYPAAKPYLQTWADSVAAQTDQEFDLWIAVDNVSLEDWLRPRDPIYWLHAEPGGTPASLRQTAFEEIIQAYDAVIFVDSDDVLLPERIAVAKEALKSYDVYGCALTLIDTDGQDLGQTFTSSRTDWPELLSRYNIFGLSNTAYRTETLANCLPFPSDTVMVDWLLITNALQNNAQLYFDQIPHMLYRQYENNTAKVLAPYTPEQITRATALVLEHYTKILPPSLLSSPLHQNLKQRQQDVQHFAATIADKTKLSRYTKALNALKPVFLWWEFVANEELKSIWKR